MTNALANALFSPLSLGKIQLKRRVAMAPLMRMRADPNDDVPNALMRESSEE